MNIVEQGILLSESSPVTAYNNTETIISESEQIVIPSLNKEYIEVQGVKIWLSESDVIKDMASITLYDVDGYSWKAYCDPYPNDQYPWQPVLEYKGYKEKSDYIFTAPPMFGLYVYEMVSNLSRGGFTVRAQAVYGSQYSFYGASGWCDVDRKYVSATRLRCKVSGK